MLDSYFTVVVWHGSTVAEWRKAGYQDQPDFASFKEMLQVRSACASGCWTCLTTANMRDQLLLQSK